MHACIQTYLHAYIHTHMHTCFSHNSHCIFVIIDSVARELMSTHMLLVPRDNFSVSSVCRRCSARAAQKE